MKKLCLLAILFMTLTSCVKEAQSSTTEGNGFSVEFLFVKNGIGVYRFYDNGHYHYFTSKGETTTEQSNGKTSYPETIN